MVFVSSKQEVVVGAVPVSCHCSPARARAGVPRPAWKRGVGRLQ